MKKVAIFDIDGTIFRSSLLIETTEALINAGVFPAGARQVYAKAYENWANRKDSYKKYIWAVIKAYGKNIVGVSRAKYIAVVRNVIAFHHNRAYRYTRDLVKKLKKSGYYLLAISNSPMEVVEKFGRHMGFDKVYGRIYDVGANGKFTGKVLYDELISDKAKILKRAIKKENLTLDGSVGIGDSESDIPFLKMVSRPICFNPNSVLYKHARRARWKVVVERKDVVYKNI
jgi:HAD superfamily hydrolase (TIGR01490 family)